MAMNKSGGYYSHQVGYLVPLSAVGQLEALKSGCSVLRAVVANDGLTERRVQQRWKI
jgi:hypothetical protein